MSTGIADAEVVAAYGRNFLVEIPGGQLVQCITRAKKQGITCGDRVTITMTGTNQGVIESVQPRSSLFHRCTGPRVKLIAANATQLAIVVATEPSFSDELVMRALAAAEHAPLESVIVLNKVDLADKVAQARERLACFVRAGYRVVEISALHDMSPLASLLQGRTTVLAGQSGMGKSTIINALCPEENIATQSISHFLASGRHTTTASRLYRLPGGSAIIDSPGIQDFGLSHLDRAAIEASMPEFRPYQGHCRFNDCRHGPEPGCALREALAQGLIDPRRFELFHRIVATAAR